MTGQAWLIGGLGALLVGTAKSGVPGLGILAIPLMAAAFPARMSVGALLPLLIAGDVFAILYHHRSAQGRVLRGLFPYVAAGMAAGALFLARVSDAHLRPLLGGLVLLLIALDLLRQRMGWRRLPHHPLFVGATGASAGFATTIGNAAGPIMSVYFVSRGLAKAPFVGTQAWFFFLVNVAKVPVFAALGMITRETLRFNLQALPLVALGALLGVRILPHIPPRLFTAIVLTLAAAAALRLLV